MAVIQLPIVDEVPDTREEREHRQLDHAMAAIDDDVVNELVADVLAMPDIHDAQDDFARVDPAEGPLASDAEPDEDRCPVCFNAVADAKTVLECRHEMCTKCFCQMVQNRLTTCPMCRADFPPTAQGPQDPQDPQDRLAEAVRIGHGIGQNIGHVALSVIQMIRDKPKMCIVVAASSWAVATYTLHLTTVSTIAVASFVTQSAISISQAMLSWVW